MANEGESKFKRRKSVRIGGVGVADLTAGGVGLVSGLYAVDGRVNESVVEFVKRIVKPDDTDGPPTGGSGGFTEGGEPGELNFDSEMVIAGIAGFAIGLVLSMYVRSVVANSGSQTVHA